MRQTVIAMRMAEIAGAGDRDREATYYLGLMMNVYCHADAAEQASWFGDDIGVKGDGYEILGMNTAQTLAFLLRRVGSHGSGAQRAKRLTAFPLASQRTWAGWLATHTTLGAQLAQGVGLDDAVCLGIRHAYEQWDGKGYPQGLRGDEITLPARLVQFAGPIEVINRRHGIQAARRVARKHRESQFDPALVDLFCAQAPRILDGIDDAADWAEILAAEPGPGRRVDGPELSAVLEAIADLADMKSPFFAGHSRGVANLAGEAARLSGYSADDVVTVRHAGLVHDLGRLGVSNSIWDRPGPLTAVDIERVRLHPYLTDRMLSRVPALARSREIAARHHERLDGSGYPNALTATTLTPLDRLLAAADVYHAMVEPRPTRPALDRDRASRLLRDEAAAGRLDADAVNAVLAAAGHRAPARREWPAGLTAREGDVLKLLARGNTNRIIARRLDIAPKTASNHVEHIYSKLGVASRAEATLFATQHGLVGSFERRV